MKFKFGLDDITKPHLFLLSGLYSESIKTPEKKYF